jgi:hypothetical protein
MVKWFVVTVNVTGTSTQGACSLTETESDTGLNPACPPLPAPMAGLPSLSRGIGIVITVPPGPGMVVGMDTIIFPEVSHLAISPGPTILGIVVLSFTT